MIVLVGIAILVIGFALRLPLLLVFVFAAAATGLAVGMVPIAILAAFGKAFNTNRFVSVIYLVLPPACPISPKPIWARTGWRHSPCLRSATMRRSGQRHDNPSLFSGVRIERICVITGRPSPRA